MSRLPAIENPQRQPYPSDLSDAEWLILKQLLPKPKGFGHPVEVDLREILKVVAVGFGHDSNRSKSGRAFLFYVLTMMATAIFTAKCNVSEN